MLSALYSLPKSVCEYAKTNDDLGGGELHYSMPMSLYFI